VEWWGRAFQSQGALDAVLTSVQIALPGIVTGIALNNAFRTILGVQLSIATVIVAHATFCIVTVSNNVIARLRRLGTSYEEASADLGAGLWTTFRLVTFPQLRSALLAGGLLAFALSFDEIIVTTFTAGGRRQDAADLDSGQSVPPEPGADRQRHRRRSGADVDRSDRHRPAHRRGGEGRPVDAVRGLAPVPTRAGARPGRSGRAAGIGAAHSDRTKPERPLASRVSRWGSNTVQTASTSAEWRDSSASVARARSQEWIVTSETCSRR